MTQPLPTTRTKPTHRALALAALLAFLAATPGCVTESARPLRGTPYSKSSGSSQTKRAATPPTKPSSNSNPSAAASTNKQPESAVLNTPPAILPDGPIAKPADSASGQSSRVVSTVAPVGELRYDGLTLPLVAPSGKFIAVQQGASPPWPTITADDGQQPAEGTRLSIYSLTGNLLEPVDQSSSIPTGLLLGRAADENGFLVEWPRADGSRWIGKCRWSTGAIDWLAQGTDINAHGTLSTSGELAFVRRRIGDPANALVLRRADGSEDVRIAVDGSYLFPAFSRDDSVLFAALQSRTTTELEVIRIDAKGPTQARSFRSVVATTQLANKPDLLLAYQALGSVLSTGFVPNTSAISADPLVYFSPRHGRCVAFSPGTGGPQLLAVKSIAAIRVENADAPGYLCAVPEGLVFIPIRDGKPDPANPVRVLGTPFVPRRLSDEFGSLLLFGPVRGSQDTLQVTRLLLGTAPAK
jgi:hypothetical protein